MARKRALARKGIELTDARFAAMGTGCRLVTDLDQRAVRFAIDRMEDLESKWSRFRETSEISAVNRRAGEWVEVSPITRELIQRSVDAFERTAGRFHPLMLRALTSHGYDRSFEQLDPPDGSELAVRGRRRRAVDEPVAIEGLGICIPAGSAFDPGGIGRGLAADVVVVDLLDAGARWVVFSVGADQRIAGPAVAERGWPVEVLDPWNPRATFAQAQMHSGALSVSSTLDRRWHHRARDVHHILDPRTVRPVAGQRVAAVAHAAEAWWADVVATSLVVDPRLSAAAVAEWGAVAVAFHRGGSIEELGWEAEWSVPVAA